MTETANFSFKLGRKMSEKSIQKMSEKEIQQKIKRLEEHKQNIEAKIKKIERLKEQKQNIEIKIEKLKDELKELERNSASLAEKIETQKYFTDASQRNGKTKIAIYSPTKDIKKAKEIPNCNIGEAEFLAIKWAFDRTISKKEQAIIYNDSLSSIAKAKEKFKKHKNIEFLWIPRKENKIADRLARM